MFVSLFTNVIEIDWAHVARRDGVGALWPAARQAVSKSYREWRRERDLDTIADALHELSDRQLRLIGMQRDTVDRDVSALAEYIEARDVLTNGLGGWSGDRADAEPKLLTYLKRGNAEGVHGARSPREGEAGERTTEAGAFAGFDRRAAGAASEV